MNLLTRCPACTTIYRVVPDQLRISQGWVKCGQCGDIFDATQHLLPLEPVSSAVQSLTADETPPDLPEQADRSIDESARLATMADDAAPADTAPEAATETVAHVQDPLPDETTSLQSESVVDPLLVANHLTVPLLESMRAPETDPQLALVPGVDDVAVELADLSFMRDASGADRWQRPWVRAVLLALATVLAGLLLAQWVFQQRHVMAARWPESQLALKVACDVIGCELQPVQRIESVLIDSATFSQLDDGRFLLRFVLKNTAELPLAVPAIELTLSDLQDHTVVRRVFSARELDAGVKTLLPFAEWRASAALALTLPAPSSQVVGYRVGVFYP